MTHSERPNSQIFLQIYFQIFLLNIIPCTIISQKFICRVKTKFGSCILNQNPDVYANTATWTRVKRKAKC